MDCHKTREIGFVAAFCLKGVYPVTEVCWLKLCKNDRL
ncbi:hypothetical protein SAMN05421730_100620 [Anaerobium acetethylicum]|uniref:Uncharacterized protein n=1 Tax=Anaerobium acetethylicum TaxID=1619234 RepID=A0A1D3TSB5_9FIRM|nr:hypothetical protein SAMN05421730_100620 [Anaerobium acetethylicum]